jgi:hypothetical protein
LLQRSQIREKIWVTMAGLTGLARQSNITRAGLTKLAETATHTGKQIELARLPRLAQTAAWIDGQIRLAGLTGLATRSIKKEVSVMLLTRKVWVMENLANTESRVTENSANMESWVTENLDNTENQVIQDLGARNQKKEKVLLQAKG